MKTECVARLLFVISATIAPISGALAGGVAVKNGSKLSSDPNVSQSQTQRNPSEVGPKGKTASAGKCWRSSLEIPKKKPGSAGKSQFDDDFLELLYADLENPASRSDLERITQEELDELVAKMVEADYKTTDLLRLTQKFQHDFRQASDQEDPIELRKQYEDGFRVLAMMLDIQNRAETGARNYNSSCYYVLPLAPATAAGSGKGQKCSDDEIPGRSSLYSTDEDQRVITLKCNKEF
jgi:hypothetical protein